MFSRALKITTLACFISLTGCGYIGEPQYPALNIPNRVIDLTAIERGDRLDVNFTIPALTTEGLVLKTIGPVDLRVGRNTSHDFHIEPWAESAVRAAAVSPGKPGAVHLDVPLDKFVGEEVIVAVRVANSKGRMSEWSNLATVRVEAPIATPSAFTVDPDPQGVLLRWNAPNQTSFRIYRSSSKDPQPAPIATSEKPEYLDVTTSYGLTYEYYVQAVSGQSESQVAGPVSITTKDTFAPAVPAGLAVTAGLNALELAWERNSEPDFKGYRVYRAEGDGPFERIADGIEAPNYSDKKIQAGKRYRYSISALDKIGNESDKTPSVEAIAP